MTPLGQILVPNSDFLKRLAEAPVPEEVTMTCIYTSKDNMILPVESARLPWGRNIPLDGMGHTALIYRKAALNAAADGLLNDAKTDA